MQRQATGTAEASQPDAAPPKRRGDGQSTPAAQGAGVSTGDEWFELKNNTSVYVTGLPHEVTVEEVDAEFSKCGVIKLDDGGRPRIKLYKCAPVTVHCAAVLMASTNLCSNEAHLDSLQRLVGPPFCVEMLCSASCKVGLASV